MLTTVKAGKPVRLIASLLLSPTVTMILTWSFVMIAWFIRPLSYDYDAILGWLVVASGIVLFAIGSSFGKASAYSNTKRRHCGERQIRMAVMISGVFGIAGAALLAGDKIILKGEMLTEMLNHRFQHDASQRNGPSYLVLLAHCLLPFSLPAIIGGVLHYESLRRPQRIVLGTTLLSPFVYAVVYGGRMPIATTILYFCFAIVVRLSQGRGIPRVPLRKTVVLTGCTLLIVYFSIIAKHRAEIVAETAGVTALSHFETTWKATLFENAGIVFNSSEDATLAYSNLIYWAYFTHMVPFVGFLVNNYQQVTPSFGLRQFPMLDGLLPRLGMDQATIAPSEALINGESIVGYYFTAWGNFVLDFGLLGAGVATLLWGLVAGWCVTRCRIVPGLATEMLVVFFAVSIVTSPISSPTGLGNSALVLIAIVVTPSLGKIKIV